MDDLSAMHDLHLNNEQQQRHSFKQVSDLMDSFSQLMTNQLREDGSYTIQAVQDMTAAFKKAHKPTPMRCQEFDALAAYKNLKIPVQTLTDAKHAALVSAYQTAKHNDEISRLADVEERELHGQTRTIEQIAAIPATCARNEPIDGEEASEPSPPPPPNSIFS